MNFSKVRIYLSPFFLSRYYLRNDIIEILREYKLRGSLLDVGCGQKPYRLLFDKIRKYIRKYKGIDFQSYSANKDMNYGAPDYFFSHNYLSDLKLPFDDCQFDNTVSFQVLEHHKDPNKMIKEMTRITRKGGYIMISAPFMWSIHEEPNDFFRFTEYAFINLFNKHNCKVLAIKRQGSLFSSISMLFNEHINHFCAKSRMHYIFRLVLYLPFLCFQYLSLLLDGILRSDRIFFNYVILARKEK